MDCTCVMTSCTKASSFWLALSGQFAMTLNWSFVQSMASRMGSKISKFCMLCFLFNSLEPLLVSLDLLGRALIMFSSDMFIHELYIVGNSISKPSSYRIPSFPPGTFDPISANVSARAAVAQSFPNTYDKHRILKKYSTSIKFMQLKTEVQIQCCFDQMFIYGTD